MREPSTRIGYVTGDDNDYDEKFQQFFYKDN